MSFMASLMNIVLISLSQLQHSSSNTPVLQLFILITPPKPIWLVWKNERLWFHIFLVCQCQGCAWIPHRKYLPQSGQTEWHPIWWIVRNKNMMNQAAEALICCSVDHRAERVMSVIACTAKKHNKVSAALSSLQGKTLINAHNNESSSMKKPLSAHLHSLFREVVAIKSLHWSRTRAGCSNGVSLCSFHFGRLWFILDSFWKWGQLWYVKREPLWCIISPVLQQNKYTSSV